MVDNITLLAWKRIVLGVTGSIACYKAVDLASKLTQAGALVDVVMTGAAQRFVLPLTFQAVTGRPVYTDMWNADNTGGLPTHIAHVGLAESADLLAVIPATADILAKLASGRADDLLTVTALAARCPLLVAPAMDGGMYEHAATQANLETLRSRGAHILEPESGRFASGLVGKGRLPETPALIGAIRSVLSAKGPLAGRHVVVTAGGTREAIDPVRYITNRSSGKQGHALAQAAADAGATVTLITAARNLPVPHGAQVVQIDSAAELLDAVLEHSAAADALIMAAAVADFRPETVADQKIKKSADDNEGLVIRLARNADILKTVYERRQTSGFPRAVVGFAAESEHLIEHGSDKLRRKGLDMLVANDITASDAGFDTETNRVVLLRPDADPQPLPLLSKAQVSEAIITAVAEMLR